VHALARQLGVDAPLTAAVYAILYEGRQPAAVLRDLMGRDLREE